MADYNLGHVVGATGNGITSIEKISTSGLVDTYQINFTDGTSTTFEVTNGQDGTGGTDIVTSWESTLSDEKIPSEKLTKNTIDTKLDKVHSSYKGKNVVTNSSTGAIEFENKPSIPSKTSDLTNDGSSSSDSLVYVETSATSGLIKNDGSIDTNTYLTTGSASSTYVAKSDIADNLTTNDGTKVLSAKQGKALNDLIGAAISYINQ